MNDYLPDDDEARNHPLQKQRGWELRIRKDVPGLRVYDAVPPKRTANLCPACGQKGQLREWRWSEKNYVDLPRPDKRVELRVRFGKFRCTNEHCSRTAFTESFDELDHRHHLTTVLTNEILSHLRRKGTFTEAARAYGLNEQTLRNLEEEFVAAEDKRRVDEHALRLPAYLGMHAFHLSRKRCCLLTNIDTERVFELIPSQKPEQITYRLSKLFDSADCARVQLISMPLNAALRAVAKELFPQAKIFVPRSEIETVANEHLSALVQSVCGQSRFEKSKTLELIESACQLPKRLTKRQERGLIRLFELHPKLKQTYEQKQLLLKAYALDDRDEEFQRFLSWREGLSRAGKTKEAISLLYASEWQDAIMEGMSLSYIDYFKRIQDLIALLRKIGRGYSIERIRGRLLYGDGLPSPLPAKRRERVDAQGKLFQDEAFAEEQGSSIARLIGHLEEWLDRMPPQNTERFDH